MPPDAHPTSVTSGTVAAGGPPSPVLDLRLLLPALVAWSVSALTLGLRPPLLVGLAGVSMLMSVSALLVWPRVHRRSRPGSQHPGVVVALSAGTVALALLATAGHQAVR